MRTAPWRGASLGFPQRAIRGVRAGAGDPASPLLALPVEGAATVTLAGGGRVRVDQVLGAFEAPVARPPWPLDAVPHVVGTTVAPEGHILLVLDPTSAQRPRGSS